ncbi:hypothetical protein ACIP5Y_21810 [Nocardia sp. NPDC088792]|uniref:hypothetical protein n=1 Tax=Nocardia sp. NPDC088792 TaxID=3364332 RepID=UPI0038180031
MKFRVLAAVSVSIAAMCVAGCESSSTPPAPSTTPPLMPDTTVELSGGPSGNGLGYEICRFNNKGGTYYLQVISRTDNNLSACNGGTPYIGDLDDLFNTVTGLDRRCLMNSPEQLQLFDANVAIYSSSARNDIDAAKTQCDAYGGNHE